MVALRLQPNNPTPAQAAHSHMTQAYTGLVAREYMTHLPYVTNGSITI